MFASLALAALTPAADPLALKDGDRVVWVGSAAAEREQRYGHWETALRLKFPSQNVTVRNLGWSGDTVFGDARAGFDTPAQGYQRLVSLTLELKPTVLFVSYGTNESFDGPAGVDHFRAGLTKLLDDLRPAKARVVLFTPLPFEANPALPDPRPRNRDLRQYAGVIHDVGDANGYRVADLFSLGVAHQAKAGDGNRFTDNGMHLSAAGYEATVPDFLAALGLSWSGEDPARYDAVRAAVRKKNELFFHRWRPQNETYLFGFRKHEQGKNAKEIVEFDPLVAKAEQDLASLLQVK